MALLFAGWASDVVWEGWIPLHQKRIDELETQPTRAGEFWRTSTDESDVKHGNDRSELG